MTGGARHTPRGRPLATLVLVLAVWIGCRAMFWEPPFAVPDILRENLAPMLADNGLRTDIPAPDKANGVHAWSMSGNLPESSGPQAQTGLPDLEPLPQAPFTWSENPSAPPAAPMAAGNPQIAASHQLMWLAAMAHMPVPDVLSQRVVTPAGPDRVQPDVQPAAAGRWSLDAWALWRPNSGGSAVSQGRVPSYGASQAGAALAYRIAPADRRDPRAYMRLYQALVDQGESEAAFGLNFRPAPSVPVRAFAEMRVTDFGGSTHLRPAILAATELAPQKLPGGLRGELYLQGGYVGGKGESAFADGQLHVLRDVKRFDLARISVGGAAWGGAQKGAQRLDLGPTLQADVTLGETPARLSVDWRERVAGNAEPDSGLAVTLSTRF